MGAGHAKCRRTWREAEEASLSSKHGIRKRRKGHTFSGVKRLTTRLPECMLQVERESLSASENCFLFAATRNATKLRKWLAMNQQIGF